MNLLAVGLFNWTFVSNVAGQQYDKLIGKGCTDITWLTDEAEKKKESDQTRQHSLILKNRGG